jgi:hypothetical protein
MLGRYWLGLAPVVILIFRKEVTSQMVNLLWFEGDGRLQCSYKNPRQDETKKLFNLTWREVRTGVKNTYVTVGAWFPLLGSNKKKLNYSKNMLM